MTRNGRVLALGPRQAMLGEFAGRAQVFEHPGSAILPGLVNCHAHLELTPLRGQVGSAEGFCGWLAALIEAKAACTLAELREGVRQGLAEAKAFGCALVADVVSPQVVAAGLHQPGWVVALVEVLGFAAQQVDNHWRHALAALEVLRADGVAAALAPHSPYTVSEALLRRCAGTAGLLSMHLAESAEEAEFLRTGGSPIKDLLLSRRAWEPSFRPPGLSPVAYADRLGLLRPGTVAVHLVQASSEDIALLARRGVAACLCPRSNATLGVGAAPLREMLRAGLKVCLGSDSLASNRDLNLFAEALAALSLGATPETALRMATLWGAEALGQNRLGSLAPGREPRPLVVPAEGDEPVMSVLEAGAQGKARFLLEGGSRFQEAPL